MISFVFVFPRFFRDCYIPLCVSVTVVLCCDRTERVSKRVVCRTLKGKKGVGSSWISYLFLFSLHIRRYVKSMKLHLVGTGPAHLAMFRSSSIATTVLLVLSFAGSSSDLSWIIESTLRSLQ